MKAPATLDNEAAANVTISASLPAFGNFFLFFLFGESVFSFFPGFLVSGFFSSGFLSSPGFLSSGFLSSPGFLSSLPGVDGSYGAYGPSGVEGCLSGVDGFSSGFLCAFKISFFNDSTPLTVFAFLIALK